MTALKQGGTIVAHDMYDYEAENQVCTNEELHINTEPLEPDPIIPLSPHLGRRHRIKQSSVKLREYVTNTMRKLSPFSCSFPSSGTSGACYPLTHYVSYDKFSPHHLQFLATVSTERESIHIQALLNNNAWTITTLPSKSNVTVERFKARLGIFGNHQVEGLDYRETFAPMVKMVNVCTVLALAIAKDWELNQMDDHNAFLHGNLQEDVYMKLPPGFMVEHQSMVCKLHKSLFAVYVKALRCWFAKLSATLTRYGFSQSYSDYSLFTLH